MLTLNTPFFILGYHLKVGFATLKEAWTEECMGKYLLTDTITIPLSADAAVWPEKNERDILCKIFENYDDGKYSAPNGLSLYRLAVKAGTLETILDECDGVLVGIAASHDTATYLCDRHAIERQGVQGAVHGVGNFVGFDVCDGWLISGISNIGFGDDWAELREAFAHEVNSVGLFSSLDVAEKYAQRLTQLVPQHSPFNPIGVHVATGQKNGTVLQLLQGL